MLHANDGSIHNISNNKIPQNNIDDSMQIHKITGNKGSLSPVTPNRQINIKNLNTLNNQNLLNKNASKKTLPNQYQVN